VNHGQKSFITLAPDLTLFQGYTLYKLTPSLTRKCKTRVTVTSNLVAFPTQYQEATFEQYYLRLIFVRMARARVIFFVTDKWAQ